MPDTTKDAASAILQAIDTAWGSTTEILWPGQHGDPPDASWLRPSIQWGDGFQQTLDGTNEIVGVLFLDIFTKPGTGEGAAYTLADQARAIVNRTRLGTAQFGAPSGPTRITTESEWIHFQVSAPFSVDESVAITVP